MWRRGMADALGDAGFDVTTVDDPTDWHPGRDGTLLVLGVGDDHRLETVEVFSDEHPHVPVVVVLPELTLTSLAEALRRGAIAAVDDSWDEGSIAQVVNGAISGMSLIPGRITAAMAQLVPDESGLASLVSPEELSWLRSMAGGTTVADLAEEVGYSERAMFRHLKELYRRLGVKNRTEALLWASRRGLLHEDTEQGRP